MIKSIAFALVVAGVAALSIGIRIGQGPTDAVRSAIAGSGADRVTSRANAHDRLAQVGAVCRKGVLYCEMSEFGTIGTGCCGCGFCGFWSDD